LAAAAAGIERFNTPEELRAAVEANRLYFGIDSTALVQEAFSARDGIITRVEVLGGKFLYAIQIHITGESYNLCPADICQNTRGEELTRIACPVDAPKSGMKVEGYEPPRQVIEDVERIVELAGVEVGGIEYVVDDRTGRQLYYDVNALSNFVADPVRVIGFNPYARLADFLIGRRNVTKRIGTSTLPRAEAAMRYGYWLPVFGGWLRNVENENMQANWAYVKKLAQRSEKIGFDLTLIAELKPQ